MAHATPRGCNMRLKYTFWPEMNLLSEGRSLLREVIRLKC